MINDSTITAIIAAVGAIIGSGGVTALIHEFTVRRKVNHDADHDHDEIEIKKAENTTDLMKYYSDEIKHINDTTQAYLKEIQQENKSLKKDIVSLNGKITALTNWIMRDNANYRSWLEKSLKDLDPNIVLPECAPPPNVFDDDDTTTEESE